MVLIVVVMNSGSVLNQTNWVPSRSKDPSNSDFLPSYCTSIYVQFYVACIRLFRAEIF